MSSDPSTPGSFSGDFREPAAYESQRIAGELSAGGFALRSSCVPTGTSSSCLRQHGNWVLIRFVVGMAGIVGGAFMGAASGKGEHPAIWFVVAGFASAAGIAILLSNNFFMARFTRRHLGQRLGDLLELPRDGRARLVSIENAHTFSKFKLVPEDFGYLTWHKSSRTVTIEGILHRYVIRGEDVLEIEQKRGGNSTATVVTYAVGRAELSIALAQASLLYELKKQTIGAKRDPLLISLQTALGYQELEVLD